MFEWVKNKEDACECSTLVSKLMEENERLKKNLEWRTQAYDRLLIKWGDMTGLDERNNRLKQENDDLIKKNEFLKEGAIHWKDMYKQVFARRDINQEENIKLNQEVKALKEKLSAANKWGCAWEKGYLKLLKENKELKEKLESAEEVRPCNACTSNSFKVGERLKNKAEGIGKVIPDYEDTLVHKLENCHKACDYFRRSSFLSSKKNFELLKENHDLKEENKALKEKIDNFVGVQKEDEGGHIHKVKTTHDEYCYCDLPLKMDAILPVKCVRCEKWINHSIKKDPKFKVGDRVMAYCDNGEKDKATVTLIFGKKFHVDFDDDAVGFFDADKLKKLVKIRKFKKGDRIQNKETKDKATVQFVEDGVVHVLIDGDSYFSIAIEISWVRLVKVKQCKKCRGTGHYFIPSGLKCEVCDGKGKVKG